MSHEAIQKLDSFKHLYVRYASQMISFAGRFVDRNTAEDLVHDVFIELWKQDELPTGDSAGSYLFRAVQNAALNYLRHKLIETEFMTRAIARLQIMELERASVIDIMIEKEKIKAIHEAIAALPDRCRDIMQLYYFQERHSSEIAEMLHLSVRTVETQIYRGLKMIRAALLRSQNGMD